MAKDNAQKSAEIPGNVKCHGPAVSSTLNLEPCPFCGRPAQIRDGAGGDCYIGCNNGNCTVFPTSQAFSGERDAIAAWNARDHVTQREIPVNDNLIRSRIYKALCDVGDWDCNKMADAVMRVFQALPKREISRQVKFEDAVRELWNAEHGGGKELGDYDSFKAKYPNDCKAHAGCRPSRAYW